MTTAEAVVLVIVVIVCLIWDVLIVRQILKGELMVSAGGSRLQPPYRVTRKNVAFWVMIGTQLLFANGAILYLFYFWSSTLS